MPFSVSVQGCSERSAEHPAEFVNCTDAYREVGGDLLKNLLLEQQLRRTLARFPLKEFPCFGGQREVIVGIRKLRLPR
jgi:hypothetical protein